MVKTYLCKELAWLGKLSIEFLIQKLYSSTTVKF